MNTEYDGLRLEDGDATDEDCESSGTEEDMEGWDGCSTPSDGHNEAFGCYDIGSGEKDAFGTGDSSDADVGHWDIKTSSPDVSGDWCSNEDAALGEEW